MNTRNRIFSGASPTRRSWLTGSVVAASMLLGIASAPPALAQNKPIRLVVPYAAGGAIDVTARALAERVRDTLGVIVIDNKGGAGGNIGADMIAKAAPDGYTIGIAALATNAVNPWLYKKMPFDATKDFAPITMMVRVPNVLVMNVETAQRLHIETLKDLIAYGRANPGKLNFGSGGNGSAGHLAGEMFKARAGIFAVHIPYGGGNPAQLALLSGQVDFNFDNLATAAPGIRSGKLKALAVTTAQRSTALPNIPTVAEAGLSGLEVDTWWGLVAPAGTSPEIIAKMNKAFVAALEAPEVKRTFAGLMAEPAPTTPAEFGAIMKAELAKYEKVVKASGATVE
ncbi:MAG: transporter substrate-binding protein [Rhizobacter sp.]|nr:transporter substrate-binding protein [Rhizobacter sp.]